MKSHTDHRDGMGRDIMEPLNKQTASDCSRPAQGSVGSIFDGGHVPLVQPAWQQLCTLVLDSLPFMVFSLAVTLIAIFESDFRLAATPASADRFFTVLASLVLVEFALELVRCSLSRAEQALQQQSRKSFLGYQGELAQPKSTL